jgi:hypothetical protein
MNGAWPARKTVDFSNDILFAARGKTELRSRSPKDCHYRCLYTDSKVHWSAIVRYEQGTPADQLSRLQKRELSCRIDDISRADCIANLFAKFSIFLPTNKNNQEAIIEKHLTQFNKVLLWPAFGVPDGARSETDKSLLME